MNDRLASISAMKTKRNARAYASDASSVVPGVDQSNRARAKALVVKLLSPLSARLLLVVVDLFERRVEVVHAASSRVHVRAASQAEVAANQKAGREAAMATVRAKPASEIVCAPVSKAVRRHRVSRLCLRVAGGRN